jgi:tetratricopeptide (TPR) repeat protein
MLTGETDRAVALVRQALAAVDRTAAPLLAGALLERLARYQWMSGDSEAAMQALEEAVAVIPAEPPSPERARCLAAHGQLLLLRARNAAATSRCQEAIAMARQVGARTEEGHALNTLGAALGALGQVDEGIARLRQARRIAEEVDDPEDLCRADHNLTDVLLREGRAEAALAAAIHTREVADRVGSAHIYGAGAIAHAAEALVLLGRWPEAERLLSDEVDLEPPARRRIDPILAHGLLVRGLLRLWQGDTSAARADLTGLLARGLTGLDPQYAAPLFAWLARAATQDGELDDARTAAAGGLALLADCDDTQLVSELCLAGIEAEATRAETASARRSTGQLDDARDLAGRFLERIRTAAAERPLGRLAQANLLTAEAEWTRVLGAGDPNRWAAATAAWDALGFPFPAAYARFRQAEALLAARATRSEPDLVCGRPGRSPTASAPAGWSVRPAHWPAAPASPSVRTPTSSPHPHRRQRPPRSWASPRGSWRS